MGGENGPGLEGHTSVPLLLHWQGHGSVAAQEAGKSSSCAPQGGEWIFMDD